MYELLRKICKKNLNKFRKFKQILKILLKILKIIKKNLKVLENFNKSFASMLTHC